ncbi:MAG: RDD family protein, partial [Aquabacterium sp.]|nr:RDD family protein [Aquabacterium sp.]
MADAATATRNPYPGLRPFRTDEEHLFFGRERQIDRMVDKLAVRRFLAVVGTSGSGKSSLVNCGLRPALHRGYMARAGADWRMATCRPGHDPIAALAQALAAPDVLFTKSLGEGMTAEELVRGTLRMSGLGLVDIVRQARLPAGTNLLVVVDQFEELFRYQGRHGAAGHGPGPEATAFVKLLLEAVDQTPLPIHVVLTMRSDYLGDCAQFHGLPEVMNEGQYLVPRLARDEIRAAITGPASLAQAQVSPVLLTRLLNDVGDNPDQLSILQHALNRTWYHWENEGGAIGPLALADYEAIGGMHGALDRHAEKAFGELADRGAPPGPSARQQLAQRVFRALTDKGTDARGIRRPTALADLGAITGASAAELTAVMAVFRKGSRSFLMPPEGEALAPDTRIDISHESLMRVWQRLDHWADEEAAAARQYRRLAESAELFARNDAALLSDRELDLALEWQRHAAPNAAWAAQYGGRFEAVDDFIRRSREVRLAARAEAEIDRLWRTRWRFAVMGVVAVLFVVGQMLLARKIDDLMGGAKLAAGLDQLGGANSGGWKVAIELMAHLLAGLPALLAYDLLEPIGRRLHAQRARAAVSRQVADAADAAPPVPMPAAPTLHPPEILAGASAPALGAAQAWAADPAAQAGYLRRLLAGLVDLGLALVLTFLAWGIAIELEWVKPQDSDGRDAWLLLAVVSILGAVSAASTRSARQATLGKRLLGLVVTDLDGQRLGFWRGYRRFLAKVFSYWLGLLGWLPMFFGTRRQALHDRL